MSWPRFTRCSTVREPHADLLPQSETGSTGLPDCGDSIDPLTFEQILEMDDEEDEREFSRSIVYGFFEQAEATFEKMDTSLYVEISCALPAHSQSLCYPQASSTSAKRPLT